jgi:MFS family permease
LIGEIFGMLFFGVVIDRLGRRTGITFATLFLILGIVLATASHGKDQLGLFWMMIVGRGVAGFGAGGEYPTCGTSSAEASDENTGVRKRRGILVALACDFAIDLGFVVAGVVVLIVLACYHQKTSDGVWRVCFGLGIIVSCSIKTFWTITHLKASTWRSSLPASHGKLHPVPKACNTIAGSIYSCFASLLEADAGDLLVKLVCCI